MNLRRRTDWGPTLLAACACAEDACSRTIPGDDGLPSPSVRARGQVVCAIGIGQSTGTVRGAEALTDSPSLWQPVIVLGQPRQVRACQIHRLMFWCCRRVMVLVPDEVCVSVCPPSLAWLGLGRAAGTIEVGVASPTGHPVNP